jgi:hypothetical protein
MAVYCSWLPRSVHTSPPYTQTSCADCELMNNRGRGNRWTRQVRGPVSERKWGPGNGGGTENRWTRPDETVNDTGGWTHERKGMRTGLRARSVDPWTKRGPTNDVGSVTGARQRNWEPVQETGPWTRERNEISTGEWQRWVNEDLQKHVDIVVEETGPDNRKRRLGSADTYYVLKAYIYCVHLGCYYKLWF